MPEVLIKGFKCLRCGYEWVANHHIESMIPLRCAKCKSPYWNKPRLS